MISCTDTEDLHYLMSWNRHCGGSNTEFIVRTIGMVSLGTQTVAGVAAFGGGAVGWALGTFLLAKSYNDYQETWQGKKAGYIRAQTGSNLYDTVDLLVSFRAATRQVKRFNEFGNPRTDLFYRDYLSYQPAFRQWGKFELMHFGADMMAKVTNHDRDKLILNEAWSEHLECVDECMR
jgi:hypothetical protein